MATILLAEDDKLIGAAYKDGLERAGFTIMTAGDGEETMKKIRANKPDLVLLDLMMPVKDGFEVLEEIKGDKEISSTPVVIMSNLSQDSDMEKCKKLGAVDYWVKSDYTMQEVCKKIGALIK